MYLYLVNLLSKCFRLSASSEVNNKKVPMRYFRCCFICYMFGAIQFLNVLIVTLLCVQLFNSVKVTELPLGGKKLLTLIIVSSVISLFI